MKFWDTVSGRTLSTCLIDDDDGADLCKGVFSKDGSLFATLPDIGPSDIRNVKTGEHLARLDAGDSYFEQAQFTDDNRGLVAVTAGGGHELDTCALWSFTASRIEKIFNVSEKPDEIATGGEIFVAGGSAGTVEMFRIH